MQGCRNLRHQSEHFLGETRNNNSVGPQIPKTSLFFVLKLRAGEIRTSPLTRGVRLVGVRPTTTDANRSEPPYDGPASDVHDCVARAKMLGLRSKGHPRQGSSCPNVVSVVRVPSLSRTAGSGTPSRVPSRPHLLTGVPVMISLRHRSSESEHRSRTSTSPITTDIGSSQ
jgi:hypothetical protein